ncbi:ADP-ribose glycohydrolase MACROD1 like protein [Argiope bruennichi]|uniref:ADP-ribose glycohydrolase MACROD1 like protein n=1 Tax=Argiope bruennichi TaxID=94029 RepID=A0A8T0E0Z7_ARGBR|nr:ADP-ribose glycohydrolase MACROD1 like protein [Argiope bruennichi]
MDYLKDRIKYMDMDVDTKRAEYDCQSGYITLDEIPSWTEYSRSINRRQFSSAYRIDERLNGKVSIFSGDITTLEIDVIVNSASSSLVHASYNQNVIHTQGPNGENHGLLKKCYMDSLNLAKLKEWKTIAFPCISMGSCRYPRERAARIALKVTREFLEKNPNAMDRIQEDIRFPEKVKTHFIIISFSKQELRVIQEFTFVWIVMEFMEDRVKYMDMDLDKKRAIYLCKSSYTTLDDIPTWTEYSKNINRKQTSSDYRTDIRLNEKVSIFVGDITTLEIDAIVNSANTALIGSHPNRVDGSIHIAAGKSLLAECLTLDGCQTGEAKFTGGYKLPARYVIHTPV